MLPYVSPSEALRLLVQGYTYLDVRSEPEFSEGHPPGAFNIPWSVVLGDKLVNNPDFSGAVRGCFDLGQCLILGCHSGVRSRAAHRELLTLGYRNLVELEHGFGGSRDAFGSRVGGWARAGLAVESVASEDRTYSAIFPHK